MHNKLISVIVCTYNRADILKFCLTSLVNQTLNNVVYEVIIVDNHSTDHTLKLSQIFLKDNPNIRYFYEPQLGLSHARNRGLQEAKGEYVAFIDDDAKAFINWLQEMNDFIRRNPDAAAFGGPSFGYSTVNVPVWFPPEFGTHNLGDEDKLLEIGKEWIIGCNMVFKREILIEHGGFLPKLGMKGHKISYGEEIRVLKDLKEAGYEIYYASKMKVDHMIEKNRISLWWLLKSDYAQGRVSSEMLNVKNSFFGICNNVLKRILKSYINFFRRKTDPLRRRFYYLLGEHFFVTGILVEYTLELISHIIRPFFRFKTKMSVLRNNK
jgi:glucosyl-dolichyl phosphate glucuronosyltransferase